MRNECSPIGMLRRLVTIKGVLMMGANSDHKDRPLSDPIIGVKP